MTRPPDIAFLGKAGAGKTTAAEILTKSYDYRRVSFADPLKDVAGTIWGPAAKTDRDKLQKLGVAVREIDENAWVNVAMREIDNRRWGVNYGALSTPSITVDDLRFPNEYYALRHSGFLIVRVEAPRPLRIERLRNNGKWQDEAQLNHVSETALDGFPVATTIVNDSDPSWLAHQLEVLVAEVVA